MKYVIIFLTNIVCLFVIFISLSNRIDNIAIDSIERDIKNIEALLEYANLIKKIKRLKK